MADLNPTMSIITLNIKEMHWVMKHFSPSGVRTECLYRKY